MTDKLLFQKKRGERLDHYVAAQLPHFTRSALTKLIHEERITVNGLPRKAGYRLKMGDEIVVTPAEVRPQLEPRALPLKIVARTDDYFIINKPADLVVHPGNATQQTTLVEGLLHRYPELASVGEDPLRPGIVHRLDYGTSGLLVVARTQKAFQSLKKQFMGRSVHKEYLALTLGHFKDHEGKIVAPIVRSTKHPTQFTTIRSSSGDKGKVRTAETDYKVEEVFAQCTLVRVMPRTGRTHQIRVHLKSIDHPVLGDPTYNTKESRGAKLPFVLHHQFLHAAALSFLDPTTKETVRFTAPLPSDLRVILTALRKNHA